MGLYYINNYNGTNIQNIILVEVLGTVCIMKFLQVALLFTFLLLVVDVTADVKDAQIIRQMVGGIPCHTDDDCPGINTCLQYDDGYQACSVILAERRDGDRHRPMRYG